MKQENFLSRIAALMIKKYRVVYLSMALIIIAGLFTYGSLPKEVYPEMRFPYAIVNIGYPGASPEDVEKLITTKVEDAVSGTGEIKSIESTAYQGYSQTVIKYKMNVDLTKKLNKVKDAVEGIRDDLPKNHTRPVVGEYDVTNIPTMILTMSGNRTPSELKIAAKSLSDKIKRVEGVSKTNIFGDQVKEVQIVIDAEKLVQYHVSEDEIEELVKSGNINVPAGLEQLNGKNYNVRVDNSYKAIEDIKSIVIKVENGYPLYLSDVSHVTYAYKDDQSYSLAPVDFRDESERINRVVSIHVFKENASDTIRINDGIKSTINQMYENGELEDIDIQYELDMSKYIKKSISDVFNNAASGLLVVVIVLFFFIDFRESVIVALVIPLSMLMSISVFKLAGVTFNVMSLLGLIIALGMLVDNAIVVIESIQIAKRNHDNMEDAAKEATKSVVAAIFASTLTTVLAFLPLLLMKGDEGLLIRPIPVSTSLALGASFIVSIAITPSLAARWLKKESKPTVTKKYLGVALVFVLSLFAFSNNGKMEMMSFVAAPLFSVAIWFKLFKSKGHMHDAGFIEKYTKGLKKILTSSGKRWIAVGLSLLIFVGSGLLLASDLVPKQGMPKADSTQLSIKYSLIAGSPLVETEKIAMEVHKVLKEVPEVSSYVATIGEPLKHNGSVSLQLVPKNERDKHSKVVAVELNRMLREIPGATFSIGSDDDEGDSSKLRVNLYSISSEKLKTSAQSIHDGLKGLEGIEQVKLLGEDGTPQLKVLFDKEKTSLLKLDIAKLSMDVRMALSGRKITTMQTNGVEEDISLRLASVNQISDLHKIYFQNGEGQFIPFEDIASLKLTSGVSEIDRRDSRRTAGVSILLKQGVPPKKIVDEINSRINDGEITIENGVEMKYGGSFESMQESFDDLGQKMIIAVILIFSVLVVQFDSFKQPFVIMLSVPMGIVGVAIGHYLTGIHFGIMSFMALVALSGIVVNDSIVLIDTVNQKSKTSSNEHT